MPETSVIIRTYNEEKYLPALFDALAEQTYRDFEVVVVDSGSIDSTREIARKRAERTVRIDQHDFTFGYSLNEGIRKSSGEFVVVVSAHTLPADTEWLRQAVMPLRQAETAMVYGRQRGGADSKFSESLDFERIFGRERKILEPPNFFANNANSAVRRDLWEQHHFDERLPGLEDIEWAKYWMERGYQVVYEPAASIYHFHVESWAQVRLRYYREGQAAKWIGICGRRDLPREVWRETRYFFGDLSEVLRQGRLGEKGVEIVGFRSAKLAGTLNGIWDGATNRPLDRETLFYSKTSKAVVVSGPRRASLEDVEVPSPTPGQVLVRVAFEGVCATDLEILDGKLGYFKTGLAKYPVTPGHEFSGTVAALGARVSNLHEGDHVVVECIQGCGVCRSCRSDNGIGCQDRREVGVIGRNGGYAEYMITPARFVHQLPEEITLQKACLCEPLAVVLKGLKRLGHSWGIMSHSRICAVVGGGPIGHLVALILTQRGHKVTVFDREPRRLECFNGTDIATGQRLQDLPGFDTIVEATGDPDVLEATLRNSASGATILLLGLPYAKREFSFEAIVSYDKTIVGSVGSSAEDFEEAIATMQQIDTSIFMEKILPFEEFRQAWEIARARTYLKVILQIDVSVDCREVK